MEESSSSSRTAGASFFYGDADCYASAGGTHAVAEASQDSGWTAYFYDDDDDDGGGGDNCVQLQAYEEEPAPLAPREKHLHRLAHGHGHDHGGRASASTVSTASKSKVKAKKEATKRETKKKRPRWESDGEDPLQDTASSLPSNAAPQVQQQDGWQIAGGCDQRSVDPLLQEMQMGSPEGAEAEKRAYLYILSST